MSNDAADAALVHVIDDDQAVRDSLAFLLRTAGLACRLYPSASHFLDTLEEVGGGCVITDVRMPEVDGLELLRQLQGRGFLLPVIVITGHGDVPLAVSAMKAGAADFIEKPFDDDLLLSAVRNALNQQERLSRQDAARAEVQAKLAGLSTREQQVLRGLVLGQPNKIIAFDLGISPRTVEIYRANVMTKMQAGSLSDLVRMAMAVDLLQDAASPDLS